MRLHNKMNTTKLIYCFKKDPMLKPFFLYLPLFPLFMLAIHFVISKQLSKSHEHIFDWKFSFNRIVIYCPIVWSNKFKCHYGLRTINQPHWRCMKRETKKNNKNFIKLSKPFVKVLVLSIFFAVIVVKLSSIIFYCISDTRFNRVVFRLLFDHRISGFLRKISK